MPACCWTSVKTLLASSCLSGGLRSRAQALSFREVHTGVRAIGGRSKRWMHHITPSRRQPTLPASCLLVSCLLRPRHYTGAWLRQKYKAAPLSSTPLPAVPPLGPSIWLPLWLAMPFSKSAMSAQPGQRQLSVSARSPLHAGGLRVVDVVVGGVVGGNQALLAEPREAGVDGVIALQQEHRRAYRSWEHMCMKHR